MYIVFKDGLSGLVEMPALGGETIAECVQNITEGCVGCRTPSQHFTYYIFREWQMRVPIFGEKFDVYRYAQSVAGSQCILKKKDMFTWCIISVARSGGPLFTDDLWGSE